MSALALITQQAVDTTLVTTGAPMSVSTADISSLVAGAAVLFAQIPIALVNTSSTTVLPAGAVVTDVQLEVDTPYSAGTSISIGSVGSPSLLLGTGDNDPTTADLYVAEQRTPWTAPSAIVVTIAGAPLAGAGFVTVSYCLDPNP